MNFHNQEKLNECVDFADWYVLQVNTNREDYIKQIIEKKSGKNLRTMIFSREIVHKRKDGFVKLSMPLFPGYIFVYKYIGQAVDIIKAHLPNEFIKPLCFDKLPVRVLENEMKLLINSSNNGIFALSYAYKKGDNVVITEGPLKKITGEILFINEKKRKAKVYISLFNTHLCVSLGLDFIKN